jgi:hypothetical protein
MPVMSCGVPIVPRLDGYALGGAGPTVHGSRTDICSACSRTLPAPSRSPFFASVCNLHDMVMRAVFWWLNAGERWVMGWRSRASHGEGGDGELGACRQTAASKKWRPTTHSPGQIPRGRRYPHRFRAKTDRFPGKNDPTMSACRLHISTAWAHPSPRRRSGAPPRTWRPHLNNSTMS